MCDSNKISTIRLDRQWSEVLLTLLFALISSQFVVLAAASRLAIELRGLHAYADRESVSAGEDIRFHVSSQVPYRFKVTRLGLLVDDRTSDVTVYRADKAAPARVQPIHPGSYVRVNNGLRTLAALTSGHVTDLKTRILKIAIANRTHNRS